MPGPALADAVLDAGHLRRVPLPDEHVEDAAVPGEVAVEVAAALPRADRGQVRRPQRCDLPLVDRVVGDTEQPDLPRAPGLDSGPLDALVVIAGLPRREDVEVPGRASGAARVDPDHDVAVRHPLLRVDGLPVLMQAGRASDGVWVLGLEIRPLPR